MLNLWPLIWVTALCGLQGRNVKAGHRYYVYVRSVNVVGKSIFVEASGIPESNADEIPRRCCKKRARRLSHHQRPAIAG